MKSWAPSKVRGSVAQGPERVERRVVISVWVYGVYIGS